MKSRVTGMNRSGLNEASIGVLKADALNQGHFQLAPFAVIPERLSYKCVELIMVNVQRDLASLIALHKLLHLACQVLVVGEMRRALGILGACHHRLFRVEVIVRVSDQRRKELPRHGLVFPVPHGSVQFVQSAYQPLVLVVHRLYADGKIIAPCHEPESSF
jgi:hypothetical protein